LFACRFVQGLLEAVDLVVRSEKGVPTEETLRRFLSRLTDEAEPKE
jgi:hypothetical protein